LKNPSTDGKQSVKNGPGNGEHPVGRIKRGKVEVFVPIIDLRSNDDSDETSDSLKSDNPDSQRNISRIDTKVASSFLFIIYLSLLNQSLFRKFLSGTLFQGPSAVVERKSRFES